MAEHFEVDKLQQGRGFEICCNSFRIGVAFSVQTLLTHILSSNFYPTFFQAVLNILLLIALVISQTSNEVVERLFEPIKRD